MKISAKSLALTAVLCAITLIFGLTPIGFIPIGPIQMTLICIPVVIGTVCCGLKSGMVLGFVFGLTSLIQGLMGTSVLLAPLLTGWPVLACIVIFIPRLIIPVVVHFVYQKAKKWKLGAGVAAVVGSLTNTVLFLGLLGLLFAPQLAESLGGQTVLAFIGVTAAMNGIPEAILAGIVCVPVVAALKKTALKSAR